MPRVAQLVSREPDSSPGLRARPLLMHGTSYNNFSVTAKGGDAGVPEPLPTRAKEIPEIMGDRPAVSHTTLEQGLRLRGSKGVAQAPALPASVCFISRVPCEIYFD